VGKFDTRVEREYQGCEIGRGVRRGAMGDGVHFPKVKPWSVATEMNDLSLDFGVPTLFDEV